MVSRLLNLCGLSLGPESELVAADTWNPEGYWENSGIVELNDRLLAKMGGGWDLVPELYPGWESRPDLESYRVEAKQTAGRFGELGTWGWKDPRSSLTLPFWRTVVPDLKVVICVRHPHDVSYSLRRRGSYSQLFCLTLWLDYYLQILHDVPLEDLIVVHYDSFFEDAVGETTRLLEPLGLTASPEQIKNACASVVPELRHHKNRDPILASSWLNEEILRVYSILCSKAGPVFETAAARTEAGQNKTVDPAYQVWNSLQGRQFRPPLAPLRLKLEEQNRLLKSTRERLELTSLGKREAGSTSVSERQTPGVLFVSDPSHPENSRLLLNFLKWFRQDTKVPCTILLKEDSQSRKEFEASGSVKIWHPHQTLALEADSIALIYSDAPLPPELRSLPNTFDCPVVAQVHQFDYLLGSENDLPTSDHYLAFSDAARQALTQRFQIPEGRVERLYPFVSSADGGRPATRPAAVVRAELNLRSDSLIVAGSGLADWSYGTDLFVQLAGMINGSGIFDPVTFVWASEAGSDDPSIFRADIRKCGLEGLVHLIENTRTVSLYLAACDVYLLPSRGDFLPLDLLTAASLGKPVVTLAASPAHIEFGEQECAAVVPYLDLNSAARKLVDLLQSPEMRKTTGDNGARKTKALYDSDVVAPQIAKVIGRSLRERSQPKGMALLSDLHCVTELL